MFPQNEFRRWGIPVDRSDLPDYAALTRLDPKTRALFETHLRRGVLLARNIRDGERVNYWQSLGALMRRRYQPGQLLIGKVGDTYLGHRDDRPIVVIAGSRAGKSSTLLEPNLYLYSGSMLVLDPKGELSRAAAFRRAMGHNVYILDPFGQTGQPTASFNALDEVNPDDARVVDDVMSIARALVPDVDAGGNAKHFNDSARTLLVGLILFALSLPKSERNLVTVRQLLTLSYKPLVQAARKAAAKALAEASDEDKAKYFDRSTVAMKTLLNRMASAGNQFGGVLASIGSRFASGTAATERSSIFSSAAVATDFVDSLLLRQTLGRSDFKVASLRSDRPTTIFICLPVGCADHFRWLRLLVQIAFMKLEKLGTYPLGKLPIQFVLDEFPTLQTMDYMERAVAYLPGFGVQSQIVVQDITQLKKYYSSTWQSFLGNAGLVQLFANGDGETLEYAARKCGKLITPSELEIAFAREQMSQLLFFKGEPPAAAMRLDHDGVARIREHAGRAFVRAIE
jgi:type IV secretion system protein VirD4